MRKIKLWFLARLCRFVTRQLSKLEPRERLDIQLYSRIVDRSKWQQMALAPLAPRGAGMQSSPNETVEDYLGHKIIN